MDFCLNERNSCNEKLIELYVVFIGQSYKIDHFDQQLAALQRTNETLT